MTGLILKDFLVMKKQMKMQIALLLVMVAVFSVSFGSAAYSYSMIVLFLVVSSVNIFYYDEAAKWDRYAQSTPLEKNVIVYARYLEILISFIGSLLLAFVINTAINLIHPSTEDIPAALMVPVIILIALFFLSVLLPVVYRFGPEKSRLVLIGIMALPTVAVVLLGKMGVFNGISEASVTQILNFVCAAAIPVGLLLYLGSALLSVRIYNRKEW